ncbi:ribosomal protein S18-alanine N-acetyltransferase [Alphaproteobacteria bacterium]|nr:ribosomal protein S18-alanine N-acetyltransferase [Alphaproteobacteria bacterium]
MLRSNAAKNDFLYECYSKIDDVNEKKWEKKDFYTFISNQNNIFILSHPKPVGYLKARVTSDEIEIISILIDKKHRKVGIGKSLLQKLLNIAFKKKIQNIFLEVSIENKIAINLYKKFNFIKIGKRKNYYFQNGKYIDADIMKLVLF